MPRGTADEATEHIWLLRELGQMYDLYDRQVKAATKLEGAETTLLKKAVQAQYKAQKKLDKMHKRHPNTPESQLREQSGLKPADPEKDLSPTDRYIESRMRPTIRVDGNWMPFSGHKTDTIEWCKKELLEVTAALKEKRSTLDAAPAGSAAFIQFHTQIAAHIFTQSTLHQEALRMTKRYVDVAPEDV